MKLAFLGELANRGCNAMSREQNGGIRGDFLEGIYEYSPFGLKRLDNILVVDDFMVDVDRSAEMLEC